MDMQFYEDYEKDRRVNKVYSEIVTKLAVIHCYGVDRQLLIGYHEAIHEGT